MHLNHAKHNHKVCLYLHENTDFNDWIVTTAFYSAIHYVYNELFPNMYEDPITQKVTHFTSFKQYCRRFPQPVNKHKVTEDLVSEYLPEVYLNSFKPLKDNCMTARYDNYKVLDPIVEQSVNSLKEIAELCGEIK